MRLILNKIKATLLLLALTSNSYAFDDVLYAGLGFGKSNTVLSNTWVPYGSDQSKTSISDSDSATRLIFGAKFTEYLGYEIGYVDFGKYSLDFFNGGESAQSSEITAFQLSLLARHNIRDRAEIFFRISVVQADLKYSSSGSFPYGINETTTSTGSGFGIGANVKIAQSTSIRFDWENFKGIGPELLFEDSLSIYSLSLLQEF